MAGELLSRVLSEVVALADSVGVNTMIIVNTPRKRRAAFTLLEVAMTSGILGIVFASFYSGIAAGFSVIGITREDLRANQILLEKTETLRLYSWDQINSNGFIPPTFTAPFYPPVAGQSNVTQGITYYGRMSITNAPFNVAYNGNLKMVTVSLTWTNGNIARNRSMETLVSEFGIQAYVY